MYDICVFGWILLKHWTSVVKATLKVSAIVTHIKCNCSSNIIITLAIKCLIQEITYRQSEKNVNIIFSLIGHSMLKRQWSLKFEVGWGCMQILKHIKPCNHIFSLMQQCGNLSVKQAMCLIFLKLVLEIAYQLEIKTFYSI